MRGWRNMTSSMSRGPASTRSGPSGTSGFSSSCPSAGASRTTSIRPSAPAQGIDRHDDGTDTCCRRRSEMNAQLMPYGLLTLLFKHKKTVFGIFFAVVLGGVSYLLIAQPNYESVAQLIVGFGDRSIPEVDRAQTVELTPSDRREIVLAHAAILGSHDLAEGTINAFGLQTSYLDIGADPPPRWSPMDEAVRVFLLNLSVDVGTNDNVISVTLLHPDKELAPK